jgi:hypothetical protein
MFAYHNPSWIPEIVIGQLDDSENSRLSTHKAWADSEVSQK